MIRRIRYLCLLSAAAFFLNGCAGRTAGTETIVTESEDSKKETAAAETNGSAPSGELTDNQAPSAIYTLSTSDNSSKVVKKTETKKKKSTSKKKKTYKAPEFSGSAFHAELAQGDENVLLDLSAAYQGYVGIAAWSPARLKFQVLKGDSTYTYDIASDGTPSVFPLQSGDGIYSFRVMENVVDSQYAQLYAADAEISLSDEFQPFLRPSAYVNYTKDSQCVKKAAKLAKKAGNDVEVVAAVYDYICKNIDYDYPKAASVQSGYLPNPDETMSTKIGICFDYASLAAAMLRSQGIPTKVIFGYVSPDNLYHAWNMFYTKETGWVTVGFKAEKKQWTRMDLTFAANGADSSFIGNGGNYTDAYMY